MDCVTKRNLRLVVRSALVVVSASVTISVLPTALRADEVIKNAYVLAEDIASDGGTACGITSEYVKAFGQTALRKNGVAVSYDKIGSPVRLYINLTVSRTEPSLCIGHLDTSFYFTEYSTIPGTNKKLYSLFELCQAGYLLYGPSYNFQTRIGAEIEAEVDKCLSEIDQNAEPIK